MIRVRLFNLGFINLPSKVPHASLISIAQKSGVGAKSALMLSRDACAQDGWR